MANGLRITILEPYYGGSHAAFVDAIVAHSRHDCTLVTMPARKWKWRMRGASAWLAREGGDWLRGSPPNVIFCNDMLSVADLRALMPAALRTIPIICYFHENQLTYPLSADDWRDFQYGMTNITSCMAADAVWFNSHHHMEAFLSAARTLLAKMPDFVPANVVAEIRSRADVLYPPVGVPDKHPSALPKSDVMTVLWSHRWEYDKNPESFFRALLNLDAAGKPFELVVTGEQFRTAPPVFSDSWDRLRPHIRHAGFLPSRDDYHRMVRSCDLIVSTAIQENFGIAVVEAVLAGCQPLLPNRLAYPEVIPEAHHQACLYESDDELTDRLIQLTDGQGWINQTASNALRASLAERFSVQAITQRFDSMIHKIASQR